MRLLIKDMSDAHQWHIKNKYIKNICVSAGAADGSHAAADWERNAKETISSVRNCKIVVYVLISLRLCVVQCHILLVCQCNLLAPTRREGGNKRCFCLSVGSCVLLSVCPSRTQRIVREPKGLACPNSEWRFPTLDVTRIPVSRSEG